MKDYHRKMGCLWDIPNDEDLNEVVPDYTTKKQLSKQDLSRFGRQNLYLIMSNINKKEKQIIKLKLEIADLEDEKKAIRKGLKELI